MLIDQVSALADALQANVEKVIIGKAHEIELVLTALLSAEIGRAHV